MGAIQEAVILKHSCIETTKTNDWGIIGYILVALIKKVVMS